MTAAGRERGARPSARLNKLCCALIAVALLAGCAQTQHSVGDSRVSLGGSAGAVTAAGGAPTASKSAANLHRVPWPGSSIHSSQFAAAVTDGSASVAPVATGVSSVNQAFWNQPVRAGDEIEIRYYRNTRLESVRYDINVGDVLRVDVVDHGDLSRESVLVLPDGFVTLPLIGSLRAAGKTVDEISHEVMLRYIEADLLDPRVTVAVVHSDRRLEGILDRGETGVPQTSVHFTVSESGTLNLPYIQPIPVAGLSMTELQETIRAEYRREFRGQLEVTTNLVRRATPLVYVMGEVVNPIGVEVSGRLNPLMAVAAAGGFLATAAPEEVRVVRIHPDGRYDQWAFDLEGGLEGGRIAGADFQLLPMDVVVVPPSGIAKAGRFVDQWIRQLLPFSLNANFGLTYDLGDDSSD